MLAKQGPLHGLTGSLWVHAHSIRARRACLNSMLRPKRYKYLQIFLRQLTLFIRIGDEQAGEKGSTPNPKNNLELGVMGKNRSIQRRRRSGSASSAPLCARAREWRGERGRSALLETRAARHRRQFPLFPPRLFHDAIAPRASFSPPIPPARHAPCPRTGKSANARRPWTFTSSTRRRRRSSSSPRAPGRSSATSRTVRARSIREVWAGV